MKIIALKEVTFTPEYLKQLIDAHVDEKARLEELYDNYKGEVDILDREFDNDDWINEKLPNDYRGEIVDQVMSYLVGSPIVYGYEEDKAEQVAEQVKVFNKRNNIELLDLNTVKMMSICGKAYRLLFLKDAEIYIKNCKPWTIIAIWNSSGEWLEAAIRYMVVYDDEGEERIKAECYTKTKVTVYQQNNTMVYEVVEKEQLHGFDVVPVIPIENNEEELGDYEKVAKLIDAYDNTMSDAQNEIEEFRQAYQVFENCKITTEVKQEAKKSGAINIPKGGKAYYLIKDIKPEFLKMHLDRLEENIYRFSKTVNMSDEKFSGEAQSGVSRKWKLLTLEFRATTKELKLIEAFRWQYEIISFIWNAGGLKFEHLDMKFTFSRNIPMELKEAAEIATALKGVISDKTMLETIPVVKDVDKEMERIEEQVEDLPDLEGDE